MKLLAKIFTIIYLCLFPVSVFAFEITDLKNYSSLALKKMATSDAIYKSEKSRNNQFYGVKQFISLLGQETKTFTTQYVYIGENRLETIGLTKWYYYEKTKSGRPGRSKLNYEKNEIMHLAQVGDTAVIGKKANSDKLLLLIVQKDSKYEKELFKFLNIQTADLAQEQKKRGIWARIWGKNKNNSKTDFSSQLTNQIITEKSWMRIYFTPGPDCENNIIASINDADARIDVALYSITNDKIVDALLRAHRRGVRVRVISDRLQSHGKHSLIGRIEDAGIRVVLNKKHKIMHNKFAIFDARHIETGSYNWTNSATDSNAENCMFFPETGGEFTDQFKHLWDLYRG